jgi:hypothetical protein
LAAQPLNTKTAKSTKDTKKRLDAALGKLGGFAAKVALSLAPW